jgi:hypothetical protein
MTKVGSSWLSLVGMACLLLNAGPAHALNDRSWVSGTGNDANICTRTLPCLTFSGALAKTNAGGVINCLDPGDFGTLAIGKSITIDCTGTSAGIFNNNSLTAPVIIAGAPTDVVKLRSLVRRRRGGRDRYRSRPSRRASD